VTIHNSFELSSKKKKKKKKKAFVPIFGAWLDKILFLHSALLRDMSSIKQTTTNSFQKAQLLVSNIVAPKPLQMI